MKYRNLLSAFLLTVLTVTTANIAFAQEDTVANYNNTEMNHYSYVPESFQRGSSTLEMKLFPNPARSQATLYVNSIKEEDGGELVIYNNRGKVVQQNPVMPGNNNVNVASFSTGLYIVKIFTKDKAIYTRQLVITK